MGLILAEYNLSVVNALTGSVTNNSANVDNYAKLLLQILPRNTKYLGYVQENIVSLCVPYTLKFEHPAFDDGTEVVTAWNRISWPNPATGAVEQANILTGVTFFNPDGTKKYP